MTGRAAVTLFAWLALALGLGGVLYRHGDPLSAVFGAVIAFALWRAISGALDAFYPGNFGDDGPA